MAALIKASVTPLLRRPAVRFGSVSHPGGRNVNARVIPLYGRIAICVPFLVALCALYNSATLTAEILHVEARRQGGVLFGRVGPRAVGAIDDARRLTELHKLCGQVAAAVVASARGFRIDAFLLSLLGARPMGIFALPVTTMWVVGLTNAITLLDGLTVWLMGLSSLPPSQPSSWHM